MSVASPLAPGAEVAFIGLGRMGLPMASRLEAAGYRVRGHDLADAARRALAEAGAVAASSASEAAAGAEAVILMLPSSAEVGAVLIDGGLLDELDTAATLIDMGSSEPLRTRELAQRAAARGVGMIDAPVSGGVRGALAGSLTIMVGGDPALVARCRPLLGTLGRAVMHVGPVGAGHALKALNNLLSATHLLASCEALAIGRRFGLDPQVMLDAINVSTGRCASTERKLPDFVLTGSFDSGFALALMLKDVGIAVALGEGLGIEPALAERALEVWGEAAAALDDDADHTEIARWVEGQEGGRR